MSVAVLVIVAAGLGACVLRGRPFSGLDGVVLRLYAGLALCAVVVLITGTWSLALSQLTLVLFATLWLAYENFSRKKAAEPPAAKPAPFTFVEYMSLAVALCSLALALISAFAPITGWDAAVAHAALPADYARQGRIAVVPGNEYSGYPHLLHVLFAQAYYSDGETGLGLLNWIMAALACGAAYALGIRIGGRACGMISAAILATTPIFVDQASAPSIDLAFAGFTLAALAAFASWREDRDARWLLLAAALAGASCGIRHTGYLTCAAMSAMCMVYGRGDRLRATAWFSAVAVAAALPWLIRSALVTGNPVYPFFASFFGGQMSHREITALAAHESVKTIGLRDFLMFPWNIVMRPGMFDGFSKSPGGLVLFLGIPGLFAGGKKARRLGLFSATGLAAFYFFQRLARYMLPFFAPMMVVAAAAAVRMQRIRFVTIPALAAMFLFGLALAAGANHFKLRAALGAESRDEYLQRRVERYGAFDWVNQNIPPDDLVLTLDRRTYYLNGPSWQNDEPLRRLRSATPEDRHAWMRSKGVKWILAPINYIKESPGLVKPFARMAEEWRDDRRHYRLVKRLDLPRPRQDGREIVDIYEVIYD